MCLHIAGAKIRAYRLKGDSTDKNLKRLNINYYFRVGAKPPAALFASKYAPTPYAGTPRNAPLSLYSAYDLTVKKPINILIRF